MAVDDVIDSEYRSHKLCGEQVLLPFGYQRVDDELIFHVCQERRRMHMSGGSQDAMMGYCGKD
jgi:hypothetical protein